MFKGCMTVGISDGTISDMAMTSSSYKDAEHKPEYGRLLLQTACWSAAINDVNQFLEVDLGDVIAVSEIATQGHPLKDEWVTKYNISLRIFTQSIEVLM